MLQENQKNINLTDLSTEVSQLTERIHFLTVSEYDEINKKYNYKQEHAGVLLNLFDCNLPQLDFLSDELTDARIKLQELSKQLERKAYHGGDQ